MWTRTWMRRMAVATRTRMSMKRAIGIALRRWGQGDDANRNDRSGSDRDRRLSERVGADDSGSSSGPRSIRDDDLSPVASRLCVQYLPRRRAPLLAGVWSRAHAPAARGFG